MSEPASAAGFVITNRDLYVEIRKLQDTVLAITPQGLAIKDHEDRIRGLERWRYGLPVSLFIAVGAIVTDIVFIITNHGGSPPPHP